MTRLGRLAAVAFVLLAALFAFPGVANSNHCGDQPGLDDDWCHTPPGQEPPDDPEPSPETPQPTVAPTPAPTPAPATPAPTRRPAPPVTRTTPAPTVIDDVEVPTTEPLGTPEIIVEGPIADDQPLDVAEPSASASSWIFGFIVGLLIGGFVGRASWGLRRRRRQQIFG